MRTDEDRLECTIQGRLVHVRQGSEDRIVLTFDQVKAVVDLFQMFVRTNFRPKDSSKGVKGGTVPRGRKRQQGGN